ncbi:hypothetical protein R1sor_015154 [Riccia sorocarpa]|uniref:Chalcone/stilbene synthase N-terminal domain-containing protein n=1 Tax=Riccia sorocarpa TaxID=122646 RepID=A0ABD3HBG9_9MARC
MAATGYKHQSAAGPATFLAVRRPFRPLHIPRVTTKISSSLSPTPVIRLSSKRNSRSKDSRINKRYFPSTEEILKANPAMCMFKEPSLNVTQDIGVQEVPRLAERAVIEALAEWVQSNCLRY